MSADYIRENIVTDLWKPFQKLMNDYSSIVVFNILRSQVAMLVAYMESSRPEGATYGRQLILFVKRQTLPTLK